MCTLHVQGFILGGVFYTSEWLNKVYESSASTFAMNDQLKGSK